MYPSFVSVIMCLIIAFIANSNATTGLQMSHSESTIIPNYQSIRIPIISEDATNHDNIILKAALENDNTRKRIPNSKLRLEQKRLDTLCKYCKKSPLRMKSKLCVKCNEYFTTTPEIPTVKPLDSPLLIKFSLPNTHTGKNSSKTTSTLQNTIPKSHGNNDNPLVNSPREYQTGGAEKFKFHSVRNQPLRLKLQAKNVESPAQTSKELQENPSGDPTDKSISVRSKRLKDIEETQPELPSDETVGNAKKKSKSKKDCYEQLRQCMMNHPSAENLEDFDSEAITGDDLENPCEKLKKLLHSCEKHELSNKNPELPKTLLNQPKQQLHDTENRLGNMKNDLLDRPLKSVFNEITTSGNFLNPTDLENKKRTHEMNLGDSQNEVVTENTVRKIRPFKPIITGRHKLKDSVLGERLKELGKLSTLRLNLPTLKKSSPEEGTSLLDKLTKLSTKPLIVEPENLGKANQESRLNELEKLSTPRLNLPTLKKTSPEDRTSTLDKVTKLTTKPLIVEPENLETPNQELGSAPIKEPDDTTTNTETPQNFESTPDNNNNLGIKPHIDLHKKPLLIKTKKLLRPSQRLLSAREKVDPTPQDIDNSITPPGRKDPDNQLLNNPNLQNPELGSPKTDEDPPSSNEILNTETPQDIGLSPEEKSSTQSQKETEKPSSIPNGKVTPLLSLRGKERRKPLLSLHDKERRKPLLSLRDKEPRKPLSSIHNKYSRVLSTVLPKSTTYGAPETRNDVGNSQKENVDNIQKENVENSQRENNLGITANKNNVDLSRNENNLNGPENNNNLGRAENGNNLGMHQNEKSLGGTQNENSLGRIQNENSLGRTQNENSLGRTQNENNLGGTQNENNLGGTPNRNSLGGTQNEINLRRPENRNNVGTAHNQNNLGYTQNEKSLGILPNQNNRGMPQNSNNLGELHIPNNLGEPQIPNNLGEPQRSNSLGQPQKPNNSGTFQNHHNLRTQQNEQNFGTFPNEPNRETPENRHHLGESQNPNNLGTSNNQNNFGAQQNERNLGTSPNEHNPQTPQNRHHFREPQNPNNLGTFNNQNNFRTPDNENNLGTPQNKNNFEGQQNENNLGTLRNKNNLEVPQNKNRLEALLRRNHLRKFHKKNNLEIPPNENNSGTHQNPNNVGMAQDERNFGPSEKENDFGAPRKQNDFGTPRKQNDFGTLQKQNDFGALGKQNDLETTQIQNGLGKQENENNLRNQENENNLGNQENVNNLGNQENENNLGIQQNQNNLDDDQVNSFQNKNFVENHLDDPGQDGPREMVVNTPNGRTTTQNLRLGSKYASTQPDKSTGTHRNILTRFKNPNLPRTTNPTHFEKDVKTPTKSPTVFVKESQQIFDPIEENATSDAANPRGGSLNNNNEEISKTTTAGERNDNNNLGIPHSRLNRLKLRPRKLSTPDLQKHLHGRHYLDRIYAKHPRLESRYDNGKHQYVLKEPPKPPYTTKFKLDRELTTPPTLGESRDANAANVATILPSSSLPETKPTARLQKTTNFEPKSLTERFNSILNKAKSELSSEKVSAILPKNLLRKKPEDIFTRNLNMHPEINKDKFKLLSGDKNKLGDVVTTPNDLKPDEIKEENPNLGDSLRKDLEKTCKCDNIPLEKIHVSENRINLPIVLKHNTDGTYELALDTSSICKSTQCACSAPPSSGDILGKEHDPTCPCSQGKEKPIIKRTPDLSKHPNDLFNIYQLPEKKSQDSETNNNNNRLLRHLINSNLLKILENRNATSQNSKELNNFIENVPLQNPSELKQHVLGNSQNQITSLEDSNISESSSSLENTQTQNNSFRLKLHSTESYDSETDENNNDIKDIIRKEIKKELKKSNANSKCKLEDPLLKEQLMIQPSTQEDRIQKKYKIVNNFLNWARDVVAPTEK